MENNKNKKSVKLQGDMLNFYDFIQVFVFTTNHHLKVAEQDIVCIYDSRQISHRFRFSAMHLLLDFPNSIFK